MAIETEIKYETIIYCILQNDFKPLYLLKKMTTPEFDTDESILRKLEHTKYVYKLNINAVFTDNNFNELEFNQSITKSQIAILQAIYGKKLNVDTLKGKLNKTVQTIQQKKALKKLMDEE